MTGQEFENKFWGSLTPTRLSAACPRCGHCAEVRQARSRGKLYWYVRCCGTCRVVRRPAG